MSRLNFEINHPDGGGGGVPMEWAQDGVESASLRPEEEATASALAAIPVKGVYNNINEIARARTNREQLLATMPEGRQALVRKAAELLCGQTEVELSDTTQSDAVLRPRVGAIGLDLTDRQATEIDRLS